MKGIRRRSIVRWFGGVLFVLTAAHGVPSLCADDSPTKPGSESPIVYRRVFVPADDPSAWPRDGEKYLPVEARDWEAWVAAANQAASGPPAATITEAVYSARLEGEQLVDGRGEWTIALRGGERALVKLGQMSLVVQRAHWKDDPTSSVRLGIWGRNGETASVSGMEATRSGVVEFQWHISGQVAASKIDYAWRLPEATTTRFTLDLPGGKRPIWEGGLILGSKELPVAANNGTARGEPTHWQRWVMVAGPEVQPTLRIVDAQAAAPVAVPAPTAVLREDVNYNITSRGLEIEVQLHLEDTAPAPRQLSIPLPPGVQFTSATINGREIAWRLESSGLGASVRAIVELPAAVPSAVTTVTLHAWQPPHLDSSWRLPKLRPDDVFWTAGSIHLSLAPLLELRSLQTIDCEQSDVHLPADGGDSSETISLIEYSAAAGVEVEVGHRQPAAKARIGTTLVVGNADVTGRSVTHVSVAHGSLHALSGELSPKWNVVAVETNPSDALSEWYVNERDGQRQIEVRLTDSVRIGHPVTVTLTGRLQPTSLNSPLSAATLRMVRWRDTELACQLLMVQTIEPYVVESVDELPLAVAEVLTEENQSLLPATTEGPIYDMRDVVDTAAVRLATKKGQYTAEIWLDAVFADDELRQTFHLVSRPQAGRIDQILVFASETMDGEIRWMEKSSGKPLTAELLKADDPRRAQLLADGDLWLLHLPKPQARSVEVEATLTTPWRSRRSIPLLSLPEATDQRGRVLLSVDPRHAPQLDAHGLRPIPLPTDLSNGSPREDGSRMWAAYRYEPVQCQEADRRPQLWLVPTANETMPSSLTVRRLELESFYSTSGEATHRANYHLENERAEDVQFQLPAGARLTSVVLDGRMVESPVAQKEDQPLTIRLTAGHAAIVSLSITTKESPLSQGSRLLPPHLTSGIPILAGEWNIWLPTEFVAVGMGAAGADAPANWRQRLFGPLGRPAGAWPFDLSSGGAWWQLLTGWADEVPLADATRGEVSRGASREEVSVVADVREGAEGAQSRIDAVSLPGTPLSRDHAGWRAYRRLFVAGVPEPIVIGHPPSTTAWSVAIFLLCVAGGELLRRRREWFLGLTAIAAILCLTLPAAFAPLATGAFLGLLSSLLVRWPQDADPAETPTRTWIRSVRVGAPAMALWVVLVNFATAQPARNPALVGQSAETSKIHRVLIPVDAESRPSGTKAYVSEQLLQRLLADSAESSPKAGQWLLTNASYRGELHRSSEGEEEMVAGEWRMKLDIEVLGRNTTIRLPLVRDEADWPNTVQLDGIPSPLEWSEDGRSCSVEIVEPGRFELSIAFVPRVRESAAQNQVELTLPPCWGAAFEMRRPAEMNGLEVEGVNWQPVGDRASVVMSGDLDDSGRIVFHWPRTKTPLGTKDARIAELRWLRVGTSGVEMEVKYVAPRDAPLPESLTIVGDRHWELVSDGQAVGNVRITKESAGRNTVRVALKPDVAQRGEAALFWRLANPPNLGRLRLPLMQLRSRQPTSSWFAISIDPTLECEIVDAAGLTAESGEEFLTLWGGEEELERPQIVVENALSAKELIVGIRPRAAESAIDEVLHVAAGADAVRVQYQAEVVPGRTHRFQFPLTVPDELVVDRIDVLLAGRPIALRWSRPSGGRVNVFFGQPLVEPYSITLAGHISMSGSKGGALPRVASASQNAVMERLQVYRDEGVLVEVQGPAKADDAAANLPPAGWNVRLVAAYQLEKSVADQVRLAIKPNQLETVGETLTTLTHEEPLWWATWNARLEAKQGELGTLRLRVPANWVGPFEVQPAGANVVVAAAQGGKQAILTIRLSESIGVGESLALEIRGPLAAVSGAPISIPEIVSESPVEWRSYLSVPQSDQSQKAAWELSGVKPAETPSDLRPTRTPSAPARTFRVVTRSYRVAHTPPQVDQPMASVRLADTVVVRGTGGNQMMATRFVIAPQGLTDCELQLPDGQELMFANLDGQPARIHKLDDRRWVVSLGAPQLPEILDVVSRDVRTLAPAGRRVDLQRALVSAGGEPLPVELSLWSFGQRRFTGRPQVDGASLVNAVEQVGLRLDRMASIAEAAMPTAIGLPIPDGYDWFRSWAKLLTEARQVARATIATSGRESSDSLVTRPVDEPLAPAEERIATWIERGYDALGWSDLGPPTDSPGASEHQFHWPPRIEGIGGWIHCVADGSANQVTIELSRADAASGTSRIFAALAIAGAALASVWLVRQPLARDFLYRWPHAMGVLAGVFWWAWLWPSWLGLFIAAASLLPLFRSGWPGRSLRVEGSTVLQVGRSH
ncbi:MAG: hypothetical protein WD468_10735 [Pirellulales bacterium]